MSGRAGVFEVIDLKDDIMLIVIKIGESLKTVN